MSRSTTQNFTCPCGQEFTGQIYEYINVADDPQLRYVVLAGLINTASCPFCGRKAGVSIPFIYSDPGYNLLAYVHPKADMPEEARLLILEQLRSVYIQANTSKEKNAPPPDLSKMPPLQVVFGLDQLTELINGVLEPEDKLGRLALNTQSRDEAERGQFHAIARKLGSEMGCCTEVEDLPDEYTVWLYGSRRSIGALMRELAHKG